MENSTSHNDTGFGKATRTAFRARPSGLTGSTFVLEGDRGSLGTFTLTSPGEVRLEDSNLVGEIEKNVSSYRLKLGETEVTATRRHGAFEIRSGAGNYEARLSPLKNSARAYSANGSRIEVRGGLLSRSYEVVCDGEKSLAVAVLLLYMTADLRRRAFTV